MQNMFLGGATGTLGRTSSLRTSTPVMFFLPDFYERGHGADSRGEVVGHGTNHRLRVVLLERLHDGDVLAVGTVARGRHPRQQADVELRTVPEPCDELAQRPLAGDGEDPVVELGVRPGELARVLDLPLVLEDGTQALD